MKGIRQTAVAGTFYPADPDRLKTVIRQFLDEAELAKLPHSPKAIIAPHAGYIYSGSVAGSAFKPLAGKLAGVQRVVLIGPAHTMAVQGLATVSVDAFATPLGNVRVDRAAVAAIQSLPQVQVNDAAHSREHGLEVMLPFLQTLAANFTIVPLVAGSTTGEDVAELLRQLWGGPETLIVISSDLSHYYDYETAVKLDKNTAVAIEQLRPDQLGRESACGRFPIQGLLLKAKEEGLQAVTVDLRNSGDTAGNKDRVVGYGAFLFG
ncbi:MAG: AmmeMemoRadiSam system protein B [Anaerolineaceae bacterium]|nr:AmmeMemoRadiSam system protein B [Anaerolineaceae bacterium]